MNFENINSSQISIELHRNSDLGMTAIVLTIHHKCIVLEAFCPCDSKSKDEKRAILFVTRELGLNNKVILKLLMDTFDDV